MAEIQTHDLPTHGTLALLTALSHLPTVTWAHTKQAALDTARALPRLYIQPSRRATAMISTPRLRVRLIGGNLFEGCFKLEHYDLAKAFIRLINNLVRFTMKKSLPKCCCILLGYLKSTSLLKSKNWKVDESFSHD